ncbi:MAG: glycosyltransferase [Bacteroidetes bacterium]|nr:glycosyltransferase [Bacteroidota bacterium]
MRILHLTAWPQGGAGVSARRIAAAQRTIGLEAALLTREAEPGPHLHSVRSLLPPKALMALEVLPMAPRLKRRPDMFMFSRAAVGLPLWRHPAVLQADVLNLHWFHHGFLSLTGLKKLLALGKPVVWTLHDMWAFTGGCHSAPGCERYLSGCGQCPLLRHPHQHDLTQRQWRHKQQLYAQARNLHIVTPSAWLAKCADASGLFRAPAHPIPNPIEPDRFSPGPAAAARQTLGLPLQGTYLLFGAASLQDPRKGGALLQQALTQLPMAARAGVHLLTVGRKGIELPPGYLHTHLGSLPAGQMVQAYRAATYTLVPSLQDNLPNMVMESLACGTPVVATPTGGIPEMIAHGHSGWLAQEATAPALAQVLQHAMAHPLGREQAHSQAMAAYSPDRIGRMYADLYQSLLA